jgi:phage head maturation protease
MAAKLAAAERLVAALTSILRARVEALITADPRFSALSRRIGNLEYQLGLVPPEELRLLGTCVRCAGRPHRCWTRSRRTMQTLEARWRQAMAAAGETVDHPYQRTWVRAEVKATERQGVIEGHAAVFGNLDRHGERIERGAIGSKMVPIFGLHDPREGIGVGTLEERDRSAFLRASLAVNDADSEVLRVRALEYWAMAKRGIIPGLSIGFITPPGGAEFREERNSETGQMWVVRVLKKIDVGAPRPCGSRPDPRSSRRCGGRVVGGGWASPLVDHEQRPGPGRHANLDRPGLGQLEQSRCHLVPKARPLGLPQPEDSVDDGLRGISGHGLASLALLDELEDPRRRHHVETRRHTGDTPLDVGGPSQRVRGDRYQGDADSGNT